MSAAEYAAMAARAAFNGMPGTIGGMQFNPQIYYVLDESPDLPASAVVDFMRCLYGREADIVAGEALKATYVGMQPWMKAEQKRRAEHVVALAGAAASPRTSRYEKTGKVEGVGAKIYDKGEQAKIQRARDAGRSQRDVLDKDDLVRLERLKGSLPD
jgi:hypothetical protein